MSSFLSRATSLTSSVTSNVAGVAGRISSGIKDSSRVKVLLVVDDHNTDWSKYFRGKRLQGEFEIKVEQAEFRDISLTTSSESGSICNITSVDRSGTRVARNFRSDFVLIRQHLRDVTDDYRALILGLKFGGVPSINSLHSLYNFTDRPWVFSQLIGIQRRLGKEIFPLIEQTFYPNHKEMMINPPRFPCVIKVGHAHSGQGKIKIENPVDWSDVVSIVACSSTFCTVEPFIDAKCDIHIQKIGANYKAFMRKSITGNWKANIGSAMLEQVAVTDKYRKWLDEVAEMFGGLDVLTVEVVVAKDGAELIYEVTGSQMTLMGETQEEDRRLIADLVCQRMSSFCGKPGVTRQASRSSITTTGSTAPSAATGAAEDPTDPTGARPQQPPGGPGSQSTRGSVSGAVPGAGAAPRRGSLTSLGSGTGNPEPGAGEEIKVQMEQTANQIRGLFRRASQGGDPEKESPKTGEPGPGGPESEDTMRNLRKTFAGIFGDM